MSYWIRIVVVVIAIIAFSHIANAAPSPKANSGVIDLTNWDFQNNGIVELNGEWEFYWNQLLQPEDFISQGITKNNNNLFPVPQLWNRKKISNTTLTGTGYGTYRIKVLLPRGQKIYALGLSRIETSYKIWINSELIGQLGTVADNELESVPRWIPENLYFTGSTRETDITIQVSNFKHRKGGIERSITLGTPEQISRQTQRFLGYDIFLFGIFMIMAVYHFGLFTLRHKDSSTLYFGLMCLTTSLFLTTSGEMLLTKVFANAPWELVVKINFVMNYTRVAAFTLFIASLFPKELPKIFANIVLGWALIMSAFIIATPAKIYTHTLFLFFIASVLILSYAIFGIIQAAVRKRRGSAWTLTGSIAILIAAVNDILYDTLIIESIYLVPYGLFLFIFCQAFMLSLRSAKAFNEVEQLSHKLLILNKIKNQLLEGKTHKLFHPLKVIAQNLGADMGGIISQSPNGLWVDMVYSQKKKLPLVQDQIKVEHYVDKNGNVIFDPILIKQALATDSLVNTQKDFVQQDTELQKNILCIALQNKKKVTGAIYLAHTDGKTFDDEKTEILSLLAAQIATIVDNTKIYRELEDFNKKLDRKVRQRTEEVLQQKEEIEAQRDEITAQSTALQNSLEEIDSKNRDITDSIQYAQRIQQSILPNLSYFKELMPNSFVFYKPCEILSGDFYWIDKLIVKSDTGKPAEKILIAAADCTGHGVPGALMSVIGSNLLNYAINELKTWKPSTILDLVQDGLHQRLSKATDGSEIQDGMDIALLCYDPTSHTLEYAGAHNPLYLIRKNELIELKADRNAIGGTSMNPEADLRFTNHVLEVQPGDIAYIFSDGFVDQIGGPNKRKFMYKPFRELLLKVHEKPLNEQKQFIANQIDFWQGDLKQIDDMLIIGLRF